MAFDVCARYGVIQPMGELTDAIYYARQWQAENPNEIVRVESRFTGEIEFESLPDIVSLDSL